MKQSIITDKQCVTKILKYIVDMQQILTNDNIASFHDLKKSLSRYGITQLITNIHETKKHIQENTLQQLTNLNAIKLQATRHIVSHDYESVSFEIIYRRCLQLTGKKLILELESFIGDDIDANNQS